LRHAAAHAGDGGSVDASAGGRADSDDGAPSGSDDLDIELLHDTPEDTVNYRSVELTRELDAEIAQYLIMEEGYERSDKAALREGVARFAAQLMRYADEDPEGEEYDAPLREEMAAKAAPYAAAEAAAAERAAGDAWGAARDDAEEASTSDGWASGGGGEMGARTTLCAASCACLTCWMQKSLIGQQNCAQA
jgi:hypothetical protein